jgi:antirestriction protein ArdC
MADNRTPEAKPETPAPKPQRDLRQELTDRMVEALERGEIPWERPWQNLEHGLPRNMVTGNAYKGGNRLLLQLVQMDQGYADPRFGTIQQINALGGKVKKGEHGYPIELWKVQPFWERRDVSVTLNGMRVKVFGIARDGNVQIGMPTDQAATLNVKATDLRIEQHKNGEKLPLDWKQARALDSVVGRVYTVFNVEQCTGLKIEPLPKPQQKFDAVQRGEQIKTAMERDGLKFAEHPKFAFYSPKRDEVSLPPQGQFNDEKGYYGTLLHEIGHATGAEKRLNREGITGGHRFGSEGYAREELRAELFSAFMAAETGIPHDEERHKAYVQSWAKVLKQDKNEIFRAAAEAGKAVDYVLAKERSLQMMQERQASAKEAAVATQTAQQASPAVGAERQRLAVAIQLEDALLSARPHELTYVEFSQKARVEKLGPEHGRQWKVFFGKESLGVIEGSTAEGALRQAHRREVDNALYDHDPKGFRPEGAKPLSMPPQKVLDEYPDLQKKWAHVITQSADAPISNVQVQVDAPPVSADSPPGRSLFWRKVSNVEELCAGAGQQPACKVRVVENRQLSQSDYDKFTADFFASQPWLDGKGGIDEDGTRHVIQVTAQDRQTLHIDPQGYDYARYVGIPEADVQRVVGSRSFVVAEVSSTQTLQLPDAGKFHVARQAEEAAGKDKPKPDERTAEKSSEIEGDKPDRPPRPRLRQATRKAAAMER